MGASRATRATSTIPWWPICSSASGARSTWPSARSWSRRSSATSPSSSTTSPRRRGCTSPSGTARSRTTARTSATTTAAACSRPGSTDRRPRLAMLRRYLAKRLLVAAPSLLIASLIVFTLPRLIPGDVVALMLEEKAYAKDLEEMRAKLGLNRPIYVQYFEWLSRVARGDLGESLWTRRPVLEEVGRRLPVSLEIAAFAVVFALAISLPIGIISATRQDTVWDYLFRSGAIFGLSVPGFWLATLVIVLPAIWWGWRPVTGFTEFSKG